jgi:sporulation protein YlmC with PRC-barrel domain
MEIPLQAQVECTDGVCGRSAYVLINPVVEEVTHLVVKETSSPYKEVIVPVDLVSATIAGTIQLRCSKTELEKLNPFVQTEFVEEVSDKYAGYGRPGYGITKYYLWPYVSPESTVQVRVEHLQIPPGELAVRRGTRVEATDGYVGHVDEFVVNSENGRITHMVMREGHLWGDKDVIIPLSAMGETREDTVLLKLDKYQIESLPTFPVRRRWS